MQIPWYAYAAALLLGILAGIAATLAPEIPFGLGKRLREDATIIDHAAVACLLNLMMLDVIGWLRA